MNKEEYSNLKQENFRACMVLAAVGDAMGYKNGDWEFLTNTKIIHEEMMALTNNKGPLKLNINMQWRYSDDTVMHIATAEALIDKKSKKQSKKETPIEQICKNIAFQYKKCWQRMSGRAPGRTTGKSIMILRQDGTNWNQIPYNDRACGCGASMRSACIGLAFYDDFDKLTAIAIQSGRITHHNPGAYLASLMSSYFTALAIKGVDPNAWMAYFISDAFPRATQYIKKAGREVKFNLQGQNWGRFLNSCKDYAKKRNLSIDPSSITPIKFPQSYGIKQRDEFYLQISWGKWPGALGIDSALIAYDALLSSQGSWQELCLRGILHAGDNDSTGTIAGAWFGALYGFKGVPSNHYKELEDIKKLQYLADELYKLK